MRDVVFMYHGTPARNAGALGRQLRVIGRCCDVVPLSEIVANPEGGGSGRRRKRVALTFDDGLRSQVTVAYPLLQRLGLHATFFVCPGLIEQGEWLWTHDVRQRLLSLDGDMRARLAIGFGSPTTEVQGVTQWMKQLPLGERRAIEEKIRAATPRFQPSEAECEDFDLASWAELKGLDPSIVTLGSHTMTHPILSSLSAEETEFEVAQSRKAIENKTGRAADLFCYPNGDFGEVALNAARRHYRAAVIASDRSLPYWNPHRIPRVCEERAGLRGWMGLARKILFPYRVAPDPGDAPRGSRSMKSPANA